MLSTKPRPPGIRRTAGVRQMQVWIHTARDVRHVP
jgi:hypothetical protein